MACLGLDGTLDEWPKAGPPMSECSMHSHVAGLPHRGWPDSRLCGSEDLGGQEHWGTDLDCSAAARGPMGGLRKGLFRRALSKAVFSAQSITKG